MEGGVIHLRVTKKGGDKYTSVRIGINGAGGSGQRAEQAFKGEALKLRKGAQRLCCLWLFRA